MSKSEIPVEIDALLRDVAKDIVRGSRSQVVLVAAHGLGWGDGPLIERINQHVAAVSDRQYRVERVSEEVRRQSFPTVMGVAAYCARIDNRSNARRYFAVGPYADPIEWVS